MQKTKLEQQQQEQLREMELIIGALEASNKLLDFRLQSVLHTNHDLQEKLKEVEKALEQTHDLQEKLKEVEKALEQTQTPNHTPKKKTN